MHPDRDVSSIPTSSKIWLEDIILRLAMHGAGFRCNGQAVLIIAESMGFTVVPGNNIYINQEPDTRTETNRLFTALSEGGKVDMPLTEMFWGGYFGSLVDRFGIRWMFNCASAN